jgi:hypothetical protein
MGIRAWSAQFLRLVSAGLLHLNLTDIPGRLRDLPECMVVCANARLVHPYHPDLGHLLKNLRGRCIKGMIAAIPYYGAFVVRPCDFRRLGMSEATMADRRCYHQDDLKAEDFFKCLYLGRCAEQFAEALGQGQHDLARGYGAVYLMLFPAYCLAYAVLRNELDDVKRDLPLSFAIAFVKLWSGEYHNVYTKLSKQRPNTEAQIKREGRGKGALPDTFRR